MDYTLSASFVSVNTDALTGTSGEYNYELKRAPSYGRDGLVSTYSSGVYTFSNIKTAGYYSLFSHSNPNSEGHSTDVLETNFTEIYMDPEAPYKKYLFLINQSGTAAPVATVLENSIGTIVWARGSEGVSTGTLATAFTENKTMITSGLLGINGNYYYPTLTDVNTITLTTLSGQGDGTYAVADAMFVNTPIEIKVYA